MVGSSPAIPDLPGLIWFLFTLVSAGFIWMIWRLIKNVLEDIHGLRKEIQGLRSEMAKYREDNLLSCQKCAEKFRSKAEAVNDWIKLTESLTEMKALAAERHKQIWEKIDNQTRLFMAEKQFLVEQANKHSERLTKLEITSNRHE